MKDICILLLSSSAENMCGWSLKQNWLRHIIAILHAYHQLYISENENFKCVLLIWKDKVRAFLENLQVMILNILHVTHQTDSSVNRIVVIVLQYNTLRKEILIDVNEFQGKWQQLLKNLVYVSMIFLVIFQLISYNEQPNLYLAATVENSHKWPLKRGGLLIKVHFFSHWYI